MSILTHTRMWLNTLTIAILATIANPLNGCAADRIVTRFPPLKDFSISVRDLQAFAKDGRIPRQYTNEIADRDQSGKSDSNTWAFRAVRSLVDRYDCLSADADPNIDIAPVQITQSQRVRLAIDDLSVSVYQK